MCWDGHSALLSDWRGVGSTTADDDSELVGAADSVFANSTMRRSSVGIIASSNTWGVSNTAVSRRECGRPSYGKPVPPDPGPYYRTEGETLASLRSFATGPLSQAPFATIARGYAPKKPWGNGETHRP